MNTPAPGPPTPPGTGLPSEGMTEPLPQAPEPLHAARYTFAAYASDVQYRGVAYDQGGLLPGTAAGHTGLITPDPHEVAQARWEAAKATNEPIGEVARDVWATIPNACLIRGCTNTNIDPRGPIATRDGRLWKACQPHWEGINGELGRQVEADRREKHWDTDYDASSGPDPLPAAAEHVQDGAR